MPDSLHVVLSQAMRNVLFVSLPWCNRCHYKWSLEAGATYPWTGSRAGCVDSGASHCGEHDASSSNITHLINESKVVILCFYSAIL